MKFVTWTKEEYFRDGFGTPMPRWYVSHTQNCTLEYSRHFLTICEWLADIGRDVSEWVDGEERVWSDRVGNKVIILMRGADGGFHLYVLDVDWKRVRDGTCVETKKHFLECDFTVRTVAKNIGVDFPGKTWSQLIQK